MAKYLDLEGLQYNIGKTKEYSKSIRNCGLNMIPNSYNFSGAKHYIIHNGEYAGEKEKLFSNFGTTYAGMPVYSFEGPGDYIGDVDTIQIGIGHTPIISGRTYTLSFYAIITTGTPEFSLKVAATDSSTGLTNVIGSNTTQVAVNSNWQLITFTFTATGSSSGVNSHSIYLVFSDNCKFTYFGFYLTPIMLAESNVAMSWVATSVDEPYAMEDVEKRAAFNSSQMGYPIITTSSTSVNLTPNSYYKHSGTPSTLTLRFAAGTSYYNQSYMKEYFIEFTTSSSGCTLSVPSTVKWLNGEVPTLEASTTYQLSVVNNLAVLAKFA